MYVNRVSIGGGAPKGTAMDLTSTSTVNEFPVAESLDVLRIAVLVSTAVVSTGAVVVSFYDRPTVGSATNQVLLGAINIPAGTAAGTTVYKDIEKSVAEGHSIAAKCDTASAGGGAAGAGYALVQGAIKSEKAGNLSNLLASS